MLHAQKKMWPLEFQVYAGLQSNNAPNLNKILTDNNLKKYTSIGLNAGAQAGYNFKHITLGVGLNGASAFNKENWGASSLYMYVSTNSIQSENYIFSPQVSFGGQFTRFDILKENQTGSFEEFLTNKSNKTSLEHTADVLDIAFVLKKKKGDFSHPLFRIGYRFGLKNADWKVEGSTISNLPKDKTSSFYLQVAFGMSKNN